MLNALFSTIDEQWVFDDTVFTRVITLGFWKRHFLNGKAVSMAEFDSRRVEALKRWSL